MFPAMATARPESVPAITGRKKGFPLSSDTAPICRMVSISEGVQLRFARSLIKMCMRLLPMEYERANAIAASIIIAML